MPTKLGRKCLGTFFETTFLALYAVKYSIKWRFWSPTGCTPPIYIYIYAVESKPGPRFAFFWVKTWSKFSLFFFFVFQKSSSFCRENEILKKKRAKKKTKKKTPFLESKPGPIMLRNMLGPGFDSTLDQVLTQHFCYFLGIFTCFKRCRNPYFYSVFSKKENFKPTPKNWRTLFVNTIALFFFSLSFFSAFLLFWVFAVSGFFGGLFLRGTKKQKKDKVQKKQKGKMTTRWKQQNHLVLLKKTKENTRQQRHNIIQIKCLSWKETTQHKQTRTKT